VWLLGEFAAVIAGASQQLASELGRSRWGCNGQEWIKVCDAGVITTTVSGALTTKEGGRQLVVEQVVEKVALAGLTNYLILTKTVGCGEQLIQEAPTSKLIGWRSTPSATLCLPR
jgi:hypothetical protein